MNLNAAQEEVKNHMDGPLLVAAVPGAGKTRCIVERIKNLIDKGIERKAILAVTFTNKAAAEMKLRLETEGYPVGQMTVSTFHSFCVGILRKCGHLLGFAENFNIYDEKDQTSHVKHTLKELGLLKTTAALKENAENESDDEVKVLLNPDEVTKAIEQMKNQYLTIDEMKDLYSDEIISSIEKYHEYLRFHNAMDFSDLIYNVCKLFEKYPQLAQFYSKRFKHILIDEMQDTNKTQYMLIEFLMKENNNIVLVGDEDQCLPGHILVQTNNGIKLISDVVEGDIVKSVSGSNTIDDCIVEKITKNNYNGKLVKLILENGETISATPNHLVPANLQVDAKYLVYLMWKRGLGYRIGQCKSDRGGSFKSENSKGYISRLSQEHGDAIWIIDTTDEYSEALTKEQFYSIKYGIPTIVFHTIGRKMLQTEKDIAWLFDNIDTNKNARKLLNDKYLDVNEPHHRPKMNSWKVDRYSINVTLCSYNKCHSVTMNSNNKEALELVHVVNKRKRGNYGISLKTRDMYKVNSLIQKAKAALGDSLFITTNLKADEGKPLRFSPISNVMVGSCVLWFDGIKVNRLKVVKKEYVDYNGFIYDLNVGKTHNFMANNVVVHNSIYSWRYAEPKNIQKFIREHKPKIIKLETNYRSTPDILKIAYELIKNNAGRLDKDLISLKKENNGVKYVELPDNKKEAEFIARMIMKLASEKGLAWSDCAILYRTNMISHEFEEACRRYDIPYKVYGGFGFYDRKEVKTFLSYMKFMSNQKDIIAFNNCVNEPKRGIGDTAQIKVAKECFRTGRTILDICQNPPIEGPNKLTKKQAEGLQDFANAFKNVDWEHPEKSIRQVTDDSGYITSLIENDKLKGENRSDNVQELVNSFEYWADKRENPKISEYLQEIQLLASSEDDDKELGDNHVRLMTIHAAKGLEFPTVFLTGCEDGLLPHKRSMEEMGIEEERRLTYVAITRAKDWLFLTRAKSRWTYGDMKQTTPSRFLYECKLLTLKEPFGDE